VFPDAPEARDGGISSGNTGGSLGGASGNGGNGGTGSVPNGGSGGTGNTTSGGGGPTGGGGPNGGGTGGQSYDCYSACFQLWEPGCVNTSQAVIDSCASECDWTGTITDCSSEQQDLVTCLIDVATVYCDDEDYPDFEGCSDQFYGLYTCIEQVLTDDQVACDGGPCDVSSAEFCCVHEGGAGPHCHVAGDCSGDHIWCDGAEDCGSGQICCATSSAGILTGANCQTSCAVGELEMCNGGSCSNGSCLPDNEFSFLHVCQ
jgi:hypothetical protein